MYFMCKNIRENYYGASRPDLKSYKRVPVYNIDLPVHEITKLWWVIIVFAIFIPCLVFATLVLLILVFAIRRHRMHTVVNLKPNS